MSPETKSPIIDTNMLFDFLVWRFHTATGTGIHQSLSDHLSSKPMEVLKWYLETSKPIQAPFHVVAELQGLTKKKTRGEPKWTSSTRAAFWRFARQELVQIELREHPVSITDMDTEELAQLGPTDASIVVLAMRLDTVVLTEDGSLKDRCNRRQIPVLDYGKVLQFWERRPR